MKKKQKNRQNRNLTKTWIYAIELRLKFCRKYCHIQQTFYTNTELSIALFFLGLFSIRSHLDTYFARRDIASLTRGISNETCHKYSSRECELVKRFSRSEVKGQGRSTRVTANAVTASPSWHGVTLKHCSDAVCTCTLLLRAAGVSPM